MCVQKYSRLLYFFVCVLVNIAKGFTFNVCKRAKKCPTLIVLSLVTGKSLSEAFIFASTNPQYDDRLFIGNTWKFQAQTRGEHVEYRNCFWHLEQFLYTTCFPHVLQKEELLTKIYLYIYVIEHKLKTKNGFQVTK